MTIAGDMDVIVDFQKPAHERVKNIFEFLSSADVISYLESCYVDTSEYLDAIRALKEKCAW